MKTIKKVATTPLQENDGLIIDSFNTSDNKHKNAPSIAIIEAALNELTTLVNAIFNKTNISVLTGNISINNKTSGQEEINFPSGFNKDNCVVISQMITNVGSAFLSSGAIASDIAIAPKVSFGDTIKVSLFSRTAITGTFDYKIALLKVS